MVNESIPRLVMKMSIPTIVAFLITSIYSLADTYFVSGLGESATAAVGVNSALDQLIMMCGSMLAIGANSYIARLLGSGQEKKASRVLSTAFFLAAGLGLMLTVFGSIFIDPMVDLLGATASCHDFAVDYASYVLLAAPFMASSFVMNQCLRSEGSATLSMIGMGAGGILNCILDPIFIIGMDMGVAGASLATAISKLVSFAILIFPYLTHRSMLHLSIRNFHFCKDIIGKIVSVGSSSMFRSGLAVVAGILLNKMAGDIDGDALLGGISVSTKIMMFPFSIILGFGAGFQPVAGFNWGARRFDRVRDSYRFCSLVAVVGAVVMSTVLAIFAEPIMGAFGQSSVKQAQYGALCIWLQCIALPVHAWVAIVNMLCAGLGKAKGAFLLATSRQGTCFIPILYPMVYFMGAMGVVSVQAVADIVSLIFAIPIAIGVTKEIKRKIFDNNATSDLTDMV
jgi:putative MATE family efflux protein